MPFLPLSPASALVLVCSLGFVVPFSVRADPAMAGTARPAPMVEIEAYFIRATDAQIRTSLAKSLPSAAPAAGHLPHPPAIISAGQIDAVTESLRQEGAIFFSSLRLVTRSGQRARVESVREMRYPTEFSPDSREPGAFIPTAFETRNVGVTVEIEPVNGPEEKIDVQVQPKLVSFCGFIDYKQPAAANLGPGALDKALRAPLKAGGIWQPLFASSQLKTSVILRSGQSVLMGGLSETSNSEEKPPVTRNRPAGDPDSVYILLTVHAVTD